MKFVLILLAWAALSFPAMLLIGAFIHAGRGNEYQQEEKHDETHHHQL